MKIYLLLLLVPLVYSFTLDDLPEKDREPYRRVKKFHSYRGRSVSEFDDDGRRRGQGNRRRGTRPNTRQSEKLADEVEEETNDFESTQTVIDTGFEGLQEQKVTGVVSAMFRECVSDIECAAATLNSVCADVPHPEEEDQTVKMCICPNHLICMNPVPLQGSCSLSVECTAATPNSVCDPTTFKCACDEGYAAYNNECVKSALLGGTCESDAQCQLTEAMSVCDQTLGRCVCKQTMLFMSGSCFHCPLGMFRCPQDSTCISQYFVCDGDTDCQDGMDEVMCDSCTASEFVCISGGCADRNAVCNGTAECSDGSDELTNACPP